MVHSLKFEAKVATEDRPFEVLQYSYMHNSDFIAGERERAEVPERGIVLLRLLQFTSEHIFRINDQALNVHSKCSTLLGNHPFSSEAEW